MTSKQALSKLKHDKIYSKEVINAIEKDLEVLELIKKKSVAVGFIDLLVKEQLGGVNKYNDYIGDKKMYLTEEEFDLIKEWLGR